MYLLNKYPCPVNFSFVRGKSGNRYTIGEKLYAITAVGTADDVYHITVSNRKVWPINHSRSDLNPLRAARAACAGDNSSLSLSGRAELLLRNRRRRAVLTSAPAMSFGVCGASWLFAFKLYENMRFYGMGEKSTSFEKSGKTHKFWNVNAGAEHSWEKVREGDYDPDYISVPYVIIKQKNEYVGVLIDSPYCAVISTLDKMTRAAGQKQRKIQTRPIFYLGAEGGPPSLYILYGPSLAELTRKFQKLVGTVPLPPLWSLGFHQSRWGYQSKQDLVWLADNFEKYGYPVDGLWLDIEYMDGYRMFTFEKKNFPHPKKDIAGIQSRGYRVVPIIEPGIKKEPGYSVYDSGRKADIFCKNPGGADFVGVVWPGDTVFPDYSLKEGEQWWADRIRELGKMGITAGWLDMNDPSTGRVDCTDMLFDRGRMGHGTYHNQYALLMAKATRRGFEAARPGERVFLLSRSGFTGSQKYAASWTGDIFSNYVHLRMSIPKSINLALSGMPFNGPDVGGFMGDVTDELMLDWVKACFLFPLYRNHNSQKTRPQEPFSLSAKVLRTSRAFTRLRYKLLPYLYNLFVRQEQEGEAILRPLFYDFADTAAFPLERVDDQFMVGSAIMQAPSVREKETAREVVLPASRWYRADTGRWLAGRRKLRVKKEDAATPLFIREGGILPMQRGTRKNNRSDLTDIELLICVSKRFTKTARCTYVCDDGISLDYRTGKRSEYAITAQVRKNVLTVTITTLKEAYAGVKWTPVTVTAFRHLLLVLNGKKRMLRPVPRTVKHFGKKTKWYYWK